MSNALAVPDEKGEQQRPDLREPSHQRLSSTPKCPTNPLDRHRDPQSHETRGDVNYHDSITVKAKSGGFASTSRLAELLYSTTPSRASTSTYRRTRSACASTPESSANNRSYASRCPKSASRTPRPNSTWPTTTCPTSRSFSSTCSRHRKQPPSSPSS